MRILILEDNSAKLAAVLGYLRSKYEHAELVSAVTLTEYLRLINREKFDFLIIDLVVPQFGSDDEPVDVTTQIIEQTRGDYKCKNFRTPGVVLTSYEDKAEENIQDLNLYDLGVVTFREDVLDWQDAIERKIQGLPYLNGFDFVIVCALPEEAAAFSEAGYKLGPPEILSSLHCRTINISGRSGVVVSAPRMGLVSCAITTTIAIASFRPQLVCMSGICGGVQGNAKIYDVVIAETCHQHDSGKWSVDGFRPEIYSVAIEHRLAQEFRRLIESPNFFEQVIEGVTLKRDEFPEGVNELSTRVFLAPASSGSAVIADERVVEAIRQSQRKATIFEMESYALYEAARLSCTPPAYFSVKAVVDDGGVNKGDRFHRVGCVLSARVTGRLIDCFSFI